MDLLIASNTVTQAQSDQAPATGTPGWATDGNPATNTPATIFPAYAFNAIQAELTAAIQGAGITLDRTKLNQLASALQKMTQGASAITASDAGAVNAYAVALSPVPAALTPGMMVAIDNIVASNTGASTLNVNGLGVLPIQHPGGVGLQGGELVAGYGAVLRLNHAGTAWILLASTGIEGIPKSSVQNFNSGSVNLGFNNNNLTSMTANVVMPSYSRTGKFRLLGRVITATTFTSTTGSWTFNAGVLDTTNSDAQLAGDGKSKYIQSGVGTDDSQFFMSPYQYSPGQTVPLTVQFSSNGAGTVSFQTVEVMIVEA